MGISFPNKETARTLDNAQGAQETQSNALELNYTYYPERNIGVHPLPTKESIFWYLKDKDIATIFLYNADGVEHQYEIQLQRGRHTFYWYYNLIGRVERVHAIFSDYIAESSGFSHQFRRVHKEEVLPTVGAGSGDRNGGSALYKVVTASLEDMLAWPYESEGHPDLYVFRWQSHPDVIVLSFKSRVVQSYYLKRLAFYAEKRGTRGSIQLLKDIRHRSGWGAHDYKQEDLAQFFTDLAAKERVLGYQFMTEEERTLRTLLLDLALIEEVSEGHYAVPHTLSKETSKHTSEGLGQVSDGRPVSRYIASYARSDRASLQRILLFHELLHTIYFRDQRVRAVLDTMWNNMSPTEQSIWKSFMSRNGYDPEFEYLLKNELFAYLLQRPVSDLTWYIPARILAESQATSRVEKIRMTNTLISYAEELSDYVFAHYAIKDGDLRYVRRK